MNKVFFSTLPHHAGQLLVALLFTTGSVVQAQTFEQSFAAAQRGDDRTAFAGFKKLAEQGNADAQYVLGLMYDAGRGTPKDERQAVTWYRKAAEQGYASAQLNLGLMYISGQGVSKDVQMASFGGYSPVLKVIKTQ
jgi:TPR repeat protein